MERISLFRGVQILKPSYRVTTAVIENVWALPVAQLFWDARVVISQTQDN